MTAFATVLLAGGRSRRMGRDKALLPLEDGRLLWQRQLQILRDLAPAEIFISGPARDGFPKDASVLADQTPGLGPLAGIAAALSVMRSPRLVVLAIDMPMMTAAFLRELIDACHGAAGCVPCHADTGLYEPLAAVYPHGCLPLACNHLQSTDRSLQHFVRAAGGLFQRRLVSTVEESLFANWNTPHVAG